MDGLVRRSEADSFFREPRSLVSHWRMHRREVNLIYIADTLQQSGVNFISELVEEGR